MSSYKNKDKNFVFVCDDCGDEAGGELDDFREAFIDSEYKYFGEGYHRCPLCSEDFYRHLESKGYE